jgi:Protein of unknown function (DUF2442)
MLKDIVSVQPRDGYRLKLRFEDGVEGVVDVAQCVPFKGVFAVLSDSKEFAAVRIHPELGTICWPSGADLDPDVLYAMVTGETIPTYGSAAKFSDSITGLAEVGFNISTQPDAGRRLQ